LFRCHSRPVHRVAKANPGKINFASGGVGTSPHLSGELLKTMTGINLVYVPYHGTAPALSDLLAGQVQVLLNLSLVMAGGVRHDRVNRMPLAPNSCARPIRYATPANIQIPS